MDLESGKTVAIKKIACHSPTELQRVYFEIDLHRDLSKGCLEGNKHIMPIIGVGEQRIVSASQVFYSLIFPLCKVSISNIETFKLYTNIFS